jgi:sporulation protein YlmC with PRC-barrel domain
MVKYYFGDYDLRAKKILGKTVIDSNGNEVGDIKDIEVDWSNKTIKSIIIDKSLMKPEMIDKLLSTLRIREDLPDIPVPINKIAALGKYAILSESVE